MFFKGAPSPNELTINVSQNQHWYTIWHKIPRTIFLIFQGTICMILYLNETVSFSPRKRNRRERESERRAIECTVNNKMVKSLKVASKAKKKTLFFSLNWVEVKKAIQNNWVRVTTKFCTCIKTFFWTSYVFKLKRLLHTNLTNQVFVKCDKSLFI